MANVFLSRAGALALAMIAAPALAQQDGRLYQPAPDPNASYVRVIAPDAPFVTIATTAVESGSGGVSPYVQVEPGKIAVSSAQVTTDLAVDPATYYSVYVDVAGNVTTKADALTNSPARADLSFYNLTDRDGLDLFVPAAKQAAITGLAAAATRTVALKAPLTLDFEIRAGEDILATLPAVSLERNAGVTIVVTGTAGSYRAVAVDNSFQR